MRCCDRAFQVSLLKLLQRGTIRLWMSASGSLVSHASCDVFSQSTYWVREREASSGIFECGIINHTLQNFFLDFEKPPLRDIQRLVLVDRQPSCLRRNLANAGTALHTAAIVCVFRRSEGFYKWQLRDATPEAPLPEYSLVNSTSGAMFCLALKQLGGRKQKNAGMIGRHGTGLEQLDRDNAPVNTDSGQEIAFPMPDFTLDISTPPNASKKGL